MVRLDGIQRFVDVVLVLQTRRHVADRMAVARQGVGNVHRETWDHIRALAETRRHLLADLVRDAVPQRRKLFRISGRGHAHELFQHGHGLVVHHVLEAVLDRPRHHLVLRHVDAALAHQVRHFGNFGVRAALAHLLGNGNDLSHVRRLDVEMLVPNHLVFRRRDISRLGPLGIVVVLQL